MSLGEIAEGPLADAPGPRGKRIVRRIRGIALELVGFVLITALFPVLLIVALGIDLYRRAFQGRPMVAIRLLPFLWWFLLTELWALGVLGTLWLRSGGPLGRGSAVRRRGVYWLRPRWARSHLGAFKLLFGLRIEIDGLDEVEPGPVLIMIRHASIADNLLPDMTVALRKGYGLRFVVKRELQALPAIDIGGRWIPTNFLNRADAEIGEMVRLSHMLGSREGVVIFPEGTRANPTKIARAKEIVRERQPDVAPLAETMVNLLPPRLGGPFALLREAPELDVVFYAHAGFDGYEYMSDIWAGGLVGATVRIKLWRVPAAEIPSGGSDRELTEWLYGHWQAMDGWVGEQLAELGHVAPGAKSVSPVQSSA